MRAKCNLLMLGGGDMQITAQCAFNQEHKMVFKVKEKDWEEFTTSGYTGRLIQRVFPYLTADQREILISGMCDKCWARWAQTFSGEEY